MKIKLIQNLNNINKSLVFLIILIFASTGIYAAKLVKKVNNPSIKITFLDVGQGDAEIIQDLETNKVIVVDTGVRSSGIVEYLKKQNIKTIDLMILTHPHSDHIGAATKLMDNFKVKRVMDPGFAHSSRTYQKILEKIKKEKIPYMKGVIGQNIKFGKSRISLLAPPRTFITGTRSDANSNSIIFILTRKNFKTYFAADSEHETEEFILKNGDNIKADILKVAHHGSRHATSDDFLNAVSPKVAVISAGLGNSYGHPSSKVIKQLKDRKIKTYVTLKHGTVIAETDGNNFSIKTIKTGNSKAHNSLKHIEEEDPDNYKDMMDNKKSHKKSKSKYAKAKIDSNGKAIAKKGYFYASKSSKKFYAWNCKGLKRVKPSNLLEFSSFNEVMSTNRTLASRCKYDSSKETIKTNNSMDFSENNTKQVEKSSNNSAKININTASAKELTKLKGIGKKTAEKIINYRELNKFINISDIKNVRGIGKSKFNKIKDFIKVK